MPKSTATLETVDYRGKNEKRFMHDAFVAAGAMLGVGGGSFRQRFRDRAKAVIDRRWPELNRSPLHDALPQMMPGVPAHAVKRVEAALAFFDMIETMKAEGELIDEPPVTP